MGTDDQKVWDERHGSREGREEPSFFLRQIFESHGWRIQPGRALDIASGKGRNACFLAERGFQVEAVDISEVGLVEPGYIADLLVLAKNPFEEPAAYRRDLVAVAQSGRVLLDRTSV